MVIQLTNIIAGVALASPLAESVSSLREYGTRASTALAPYRRVLGWTEMVLGVINFVQLATTLHLPFINGGFTQSVAAIVAGFLLAEDIDTYIPGLASIRQSIVVYKTYIGLGALVVGMYAFI
jgi:hypothetical protein